MNINYVFIVKSLIIKNYIKEILDCANLRIFWYIIRIVIYYVQESK